MLSHYPAISCFIKQFVNDWNVKETSDKKILYTLTNLALIASSK
jgi:hypothetical protein